MKEDTRAPEEVSHTKVITTQLTHPFHQDRNDSILATASMISSAKIPRPCHSSAREDWNCADYFTQNISVWLDGWDEEKNLAPHGSFFNPAVGRILMQWKLRCVWMSTSRGQGLNLDVLKIWRMVETLSLQVSSLAKGQFVGLLTVQGWI